MSSLLKSVIHARTIPSIYVYPSRPSSSAMTLNCVYKAKCFDGEQGFYTHISDVLKCKMDFGIYLPPKAIQGKKDCPVLYQLNGLTATHENFIRKSGFHRFAAKLDLCIVSPDTSPRGIEYPKHEFIGPGGGFYIDALQEPWAKHFQMHTYVTKELIELIKCNFPVSQDKQGISGFSMGGYGALLGVLKNPGLYQSISAFAPACNPIKREKGRMILDVLIGKDEEEWKKWDPCVLAANYNSAPIEIFIDQGESDEFLREHLMPQNFLEATKNHECIKVVYKERAGYDHTHYYLSTFVEEHMEYHSKLLNS